MKYEKQFGNIVLKETDSYKWGVEDLNGNIIVPYGKYAWIDDFECGLARVRTEGKTTYTKNIIGILDENSFINNQEEIQTIVQREFVEHRENFAKWGIIDVTGKEVLPLEYDNIWNFKNKGRTSTYVEKNCYGYDFDFCTRSLMVHHDSYIRKKDFGEHYNHHYGEFAGSYAQDVMGYSDDVINDAFEGDPDAYWNID